MNIVYQGFFLREGLRLLGHNVIELSFCEDEDINAKLDTVSCSIDFVLLELWGNENIPTGLYKCKYTLAAYCIDSPINEFYILDLCCVFDHVFVDQKTSVTVFKKNKLNAIWLPLCAQESYFRKWSENKKYDIIFVGNTSSYRAKRDNLLALLRKNFSINVYQGISSNEMLDLFSQSKIVVNENLFSGLTLRVFQGLASGAVVMTEEGGSGVEDHFQDGEHLLCYNPDNVLRKFDDVLSSYDSYVHIAAAGYDACKRAHTSKLRAHAFLAAMEEKSAWNNKPAEICRKYFETKARYAMRMRFGGRLDGVVADFKSIASTGGDMAAPSLLELGNITARNNEPEKAKKFYTESLALDNNAYIHLRFALLHIHVGDIKQAECAIDEAVRTIPRHMIPNYSGVSALLKQATEPSELLFIIAHLYFACDRIFSVGFLKQFRDDYPETALETAFMVWENNPSAAVMDFMLACTKIFNIEGELLPELVAAVKEVRLSDAQILYTAEIAKQYYDFDLARQITFSLKRNRSVR